MNKIKTYRFDTRREALAAARGYTCALGVSNPDRYIQTNNGSIENLNSELVSGYVIDPSNCLRICFNVRNRKLSA